MRMPKRLRDPNLAANAVRDDGLRWHDALTAPCVLEGFPFRTRGGELYRLPKAIVPGLPPLLQHVAAQPAGAGLRVAARGDRLAIRVQLSRNETSRNCTYAATHGFDAYVDGPLGWTFVGNLSVEKPCQRWSAEVRIPARLAGELGRGPRQWLLHLPLQNPVAGLEIGLEGAPAKPRPRRLKNPLVCYGSSITQGFCASRPGLAWTNLVARELDAELIPLGFGGSARGEPEVAEAIASLDAACLVVDYDHNAPNPEHLAATHLPFLGIIRAARPRLPIVIASSPNFHGERDWWGRRRAIIRASAKAIGGPVRFVDGERYFSAAGWADATIDRCHPNDLGFRRMADLLLPAIRAAMRAAGS
jgi:lysophospholipase L1-like esterase